MMNLERLRCREPTATVKKSTPDVLAKQRQKVDVGAPLPSTRDHRGVKDDPLEPPWEAAPPTTTGETVFHVSQADRFRSLTVTEADLSGLEAPEGYHRGFKIRVAKLGGRPREAGKFVERRYTGRGYAIPKVQDLPLAFIAYDDGKLVGTVSVRLDSEQGLSADELYHEELAPLRRAGARLCEFTRLAVDRTTASKPVLAGLFHTAYLYASVIRGCTHAVIEVIPRHAAFYGRALSFVPIGQEQLNPRVNTTGVLLYAPFATIADGIKRFAGKPDASGAGRSLFVYGFAPVDEPGVLRRLRELVAAL